ncbi:MAG: ROK family transcriptional regulator [Lachnospiraceae bacterium]|nr:ROK family transcriptional regulator [Lachnospiraceae bacterium]
MEAKTNSDVRSNNRKRLVNLLFMQGEMTKQEMVGRLDMSLATVNYLVRELTERGLLTAGTAKDSTGGRKPVCICPVYDARFSIGVEAASDELHLVLLDLGGHILAKETVPMKQENTCVYWQQVGKRIRAFGEEHKIDKEKLLDVGITLGVTMQDERLVERKYGYPGFAMDLAAAREGLSMPVHFRNSTKMAAVAHCWQGTRQGSFLYVNLGQKLSAAFVHEGNVLDFAGLNGELGCMLAAGEPKVRYLDEILSRETICQRTGSRNLAEFFGRLKAQEPESCAYWETYLGDLSAFLYNLYCMLGWRIVIGGSSSPYLAEYLPAVEEQIRRHYPFEGPEDRILSTSVLGEYGAAVGAAMLPVDQYLEFKI